MSLNVPPSVSGWKAIQRLVIAYASLQFACWFAMFGFCCCSLYFFSLHFALAAVLVLLQLALCSCFCTL